VRLLLTNDDGVGAPGLRALEAAAAAFGEVLVVAPAQEQSGCGHLVTTHAAIAVERLAEGRWTVHGSPADCVRLAVSELVGPVDWVLSGINAGGNLGTDIYHSGTVAAAREAALLGVPGLALSHLRRRGVPLDWDDAWLRARAALSVLLSTPPIPGCYWNLNLPHLDVGAPIGPVVRCDLDPSPLPVRFALSADGSSYRYCGDYHQRHRRPLSDVDRCFAGQTTLTEHRL
jgi:5'-nucleotidase